MINKIDLNTLNALPWLKIFTQTIGQPENLPKLLADYGVTSQQLLSIAEKSADSSEPYGRKIIFNNEQIEVMLASWSFQAMASPHNHGSSKGLIWFACGNFSEQHFKFSNNELKKTDELRFQENQVVSVDTNDIHSCCPENTGLSLHIYSPPIQQMKVWDVEQKKTLTVADHCGAWIPKNKSLIVKEISW